MYAALASSSTVTVSTRVSLASDARCPLKVCLFRAYTVCLALWRVKQTSQVTRWRLAVTSDNATGNVVIDARPVSGLFTRPCKSCMQRPGAACMRVSVHQVRPWAIQRVMPHAKGSGRVVEIAFVRTLVTNVNLYRGLRFHRYSFLFASCDYVRRSPRWGRLPL